MDTRFPELHQIIKDLAVGESHTFDNLDGRTVQDYRGEMTYWYTGHVEPTDDRLKDPDFPASKGDWNWRMTDTWTRDRVSKLFSWTITKVEVPDDQKYISTEMRVINAQKAVEQAQAALDRAIEKFNATKQ